jgi:phytanoyl-CoA hydroxylase
LALDPRIIDIVSQLGIEFPNVCTRPVLFFNASKLAKKQVYWKMDPHQDWRSMQGSINSIVAWVAMCDIDISLGALEIIPESHKLGLQAKEMVDSFGLIPEIALTGKKFVPVEVKKGDVLFFSSFLIHQSGNNSTENGIRWSSHFRYNDMNEPQFIERGYPHPYVYHPNPELITTDYPENGLVEKYFK